MRRFYLYNALGEHYNLNDVDNFFHDVGGLGFQKRCEFKKYGQNFQLRKTDYEQPVITGKIRFKKPYAYAKYDRFIKFLQHEPLRLEYAPGDRTYSLDCTCTLCDKKELSMHNLDIDVEFTGTTLWYRLIKKRDATVIKIRSDTSIISPCSLTLENCREKIVPTWTHTFTEDGIDKSERGEMDGTPSQGDSIQIRTDTVPYQILKIKGDWKCDAYDMMKTETERFMFIREGINTFKCTGADTMLLEAKLYYESV